MIDCEQCIIFSKDLVWQDDKLERYEEIECMVREIRWGCEEECSGANTVKNQRDQKVLNMVFAYGEIKLTAESGYMLIYTRWL